MTSRVIAFSAPKTLKRCRPLGALLQHRVKHHRYPRNAPKTKWAASTKKTARSPACASAKRGCNFVLIVLLHLRIGFGRQQPHLEAFQTALLEKPTNPRRTPANAGQGFEHDDSFIDRLGRMFSQVCLEGLTMHLQCTLGAVTRQLFQGLYAPSLIVFQVRA